MTFRSPAQFALCILVFAAAAAGQITGDLAVQVADATGAAVSGATVSIQSIAQRTTRELETDSQGDARFTLLGIGDYEVRVNASGFTTLVTRAVINSGAVYSLKAPLQVSASRQEIVVESNVLSINTTNAQVQTSFDLRAIQQLPMPVSVLSLAATTPGVVPVGPRNPYLGQGHYNSNGGRSRGNNITIDNASALDTSSGGGAGLGTVPLDAIREINVISNNFNAEYGRNASSQFQILTKSGTNDLHGSAAHFFQNDVLNARDYFDRTGKASVLRDNHWFVTAGGNIVRDRLFFFGSYEQQRTRGAGGTRLAIVPTQVQVDGITSAAARQLFGASQGVTSPSGTVSNAAPLGGNSIAYSGKIDWNMTKRDTLSGRYGYQDSESRSPSLTFISSSLPTNGASTVSKPQNVTLNYTRVQSASMVINSIGTFGRSTAYFSPLAEITTPSVVFQDGTSELGSWSGLPQGRTQNVYNSLTTVTKTLGSHTFKTGYNLERIQLNSIFNSNVRGTLTFPNFAAFQAGTPSLYSQRFGGSVRGHRTLNQGFFFQDDWRVSRTLTLNLGLRTEVAGGVNEVNGLLSNLNLDKQAALGAAGTGALGSFDIGGTSSKTNINWGPRVGFAWNPNGSHWSIRGGYGINYDAIFLNPVGNLRFAPPFMYNFSTTDFTGSNSLANILQGTSAFQQVGQSTLGNFGTTLKNFGSLSPVDQALRNPQVQQWSLNIERQLGAGLLARAGYVGTKGNFLLRGRPINTVRSGLVIPATSTDDEQARLTEFRAINTGLNASPTGQTNRIDPRFTGVTLIDSSANSNYHSFQAYLARSFRSNLGFTAAYTWSKSIDDVSDVVNSFPSDAITQQNPFDNANNRGLSAYDVPHRFVVTHSYDLPKFSNSRGFMKQTLGGWNLSGIFQTQSGNPVNLLSGTRLALPDPLLLGGGGALRPNLNGPLNLTFAPNPGTVTAADYKTTNSGLSQPLIGNIGNLGRNVIRQNGLTQYDVTLQKTFVLSERYRLQFQSQASNLFNNTSFGQPGRTFASPQTFGYYQDTDTNSRAITLVGRFIF